MNKYEIKILVGSEAIKKLGNSINAKKISYLINDELSTEIIIEDEKNIYFNANGSLFFKEIYNLEKKHKIASPQSLLELKAYEYLNRDKENINERLAMDLDLCYLITSYDVVELKILNKYVSKEKTAVIEKIIADVLEKYRKFHIRYQ